MEGRLVVDVKDQNSREEHIVEKKISTNTTNCFGILSLSPSVVGPLHLWAISSWALYIRRIHW